MLSQPLTRICLLTHLFFLYLFLFFYFVSCATTCSPSSKGKVERVSEGGRGREGLGLGSDMDDHISESSFVDHGQEAETGEGLQPQWSVEKLDGSGTCDNDGDEDVDGARDTVSSVLLHLEDAVRRARARSERLLRSNRHLRDEKRKLVEANASLQECNRLLAYHTSELMVSVASLDRSHRESQLATANLAQQLQEIKAAVHLLVEKVVNKSENSVQGECNC